MSNTFPVLCVSVHHALGGRALWLIVLGHRNGPEAQAQATIAGYRLNRVLGGFSGHFALDARWSAYYLRVNEVVVVATYPTVVDGGDAMAAAGAARGALVEVCGGKQGEVSLLTLSKSGAEVQLALRRAVLGNGRVVGIGSPKFDVAAVQLCSEPPPDDATSVALRATNDITSPTAVGASNDAWLFGCNKSNSLGEALTRVLRPTPAALGGVRDTWAAGLHVSSEASIKAYLSLPPSKLKQPVGARSGSGTGGGRRPAPLAPRLDLLPKGVASALAALDQRGFLAGAGAGGGVGYDTALGSYGGMWEPSNSGGGSGEFITLPLSQAFAPPPIPHFNVTIRVAAQCVETATVTDGGAGGGSSCAISGVCTLRVMYGNALPGEVEESGHGPLAFVLHFIPPGPLISLTHVKPSAAAAAAAAADLGIGGVGGGAGNDKSGGEELLPSNYSYKPGAPVVIPLTLPTRPPGTTTYTPGDLGQLQYRVSPTFSPPPLLAVSAGCKTTWGEQPGGGWAPKHTDVLLKTCLDSGRLDLAPTLVHFLVTLPPPPSSTSLAAPVCSPPAQWSAPRAQLLWSLGEAPGGDSSSKEDSSGSAGASAGAGASAPPTVVSHFAPGKPALFRARAPIVLPVAGEGGVVATTATDPTGTLQLQTLPVQARFSFSNGALAPVAFSVPSAPSGGGGAGKGSTAPSRSHSATDPQPLNTDTDMSGMGLRVQIIGLLVKSSSNVRAMFK